MNNDRNLRALWAIPLMGLLVLAAIPTSAESVADNQPIVSVAMHGGVASFAPRVSSDGMTLTVAGRGHVFEQRLSSGQAASFAPIDREGYALPDGTYKWEIVLSSRLQDLEPRALQDGKASPDGRTVEVAEAPRRRKQSGVFSIKNGMLVDPSLIEQESGRAAPSLAPEASEAPSAAARTAEQTDRDGS